jgi:pyrroline-5-carboxylate reductase
MTDQLRLTLIGCGNMGSALLAGWLGLKQIAHIAIVDPDPKLPDSAERDPRITLYKDAEELAGNGDNNCDICVSAVKPQIMGEVLQDLQNAGMHAELMISIAAGITMDDIRRNLKTDTRIVRVMPNTPSVISRGVLAVCPGDDLSQVQEESIQALLQVCGAVVWLDDEAYMDAVTAVSGSGPAYVFAMIEALAEAGMAEGLPPDLATKLARHTVEGATDLSAHYSDTDIAALRDNVTSPGGTTEAGLKVLLDPTHGLKPLLRKTVNAARQRGEELSG